MQHTPQQEALCEAVARTTGHVCTNAVAGAGKTSTAIAAASRARGNVGFVAFNKHIATELNERLNGSATACTLHSLGLRACKRAFGSELDEHKLERLLQQQEPNWFWKGRLGNHRPSEDAIACMQLARLCKYTLTDPTDTVELDNLVKHHDLDLCDNSPEIYKATASLLETCVRETALVDFDDMIWLPSRHGLSVAAFDTLFVDESQDLNRCQQQLIWAVGAQLIAIGDNRQAIYGFSGSDNAAFEQLRDRMLCSSRGSQDRPLTVTFRCPVRHVELARRIVPEIEAAPNAVEGTIEAVDPDVLPETVMVGDLVICRVNAPLVSLTLQLIVRGIPATMRGRDIGRGLQDLIIKLKPSSIRDLAKKLNHYLTKELARLERKLASEAAFQSVNDRVDCLTNLCSQIDTLDQLQEFLNTCFRDDSTRKAQVVLSSVHRAKGLEANRVAIVAPDKLPMVRSDSQSWEITQEMNLLYIAVTRARRELVFAGPVPAVLGEVQLDRPLGSY